MTETKKQTAGSLLGKVILVGTYGLVFLSYALAGATVLSLAFPAFPFFVFMLLAGFLCGKLDYRFNGPACRTEKRYAEYISKVEK